MAAGYTHYLFGELRQVNESRVVPNTASALKDWLDAWLPRWVQSAEEAEPNFEDVQKRCCDWQTGDRSEEVGVISLPLVNKPEFDGERYEHLICRVYFNWASGGRVSRTGHAVVLTDVQWGALDHNPFRLPHLVKNAAAFASSAPLPFDSFGTGEEAPNSSGVGTGEAALLAAIWRGKPPVRLPTDAEPRLYELLLLSLETKRRASTSCVCGPFGLKRAYQDRIDIGPAAALSVSPQEPAKNSRCIERLDAPQRLDGCWDVTWESLGLDIPGPVAPASVAPSSAQLAPGQPPLTIGREGQSNGAKGKLVLAIGVGLLLLVAAGLFWGPGLWEAQRLGDDCTAWVRDFDDSAKRLSDTRALLKRAEALFVQDPDSQVCAGQTGRVRALIDLYRSRLAEIERSPAVTDTDVRKINRLNADLTALGALPQVLDTDGTRYETLLSASDRLYRLAAHWVSSAGKAQDLRTRYEFLRNDEVAQGLAPNPRLTDIAAQVRALEQQEALDALRAAAARVGPLDRAGLDTVRNLSSGFGALYPNERGDELAGVLAEAAMQFEKGARPPLQAAFDALQPRPTTDNLAALEAAVAAYQRDLAPASALTPQVGIDTAALLGRLKTDRIVHVSVTQPPVGERAEVGRLAGPGQCEPQQDFPLFADDVICVRVFRMPLPAPLPPTRSAEPAPRERLETDGPDWLKRLSDLFDALSGLRRGGNLTGDVYSVPLQDLLSGTWRSPDERITLRAKIEWPSLDKFRR